MIYIVRINDTEYEVEVERGQAGIVRTTEVAAAPTAAPVAQPVVETATPQPQGSGEVIEAPMPGTILALKVAVGDTVKTGDVLLIFEAMKMENEITAPRDGTITDVRVAKGAQIQTSDALLSLS